MLNKVSCRQSGYSGLAHRVRHGTWHTAGPRHPLLNPQQPGTEEIWRPPPPSVSSFQPRGQCTLLCLPLFPSQVRGRGCRGSPPKACTHHPCLQPLPQPWFLSHCQSTMAVIINGLSQCDSCGPLKIGLNNKILAYGNFFSSPAPSFPSPSLQPVMHANVFPFSSFPNTFLLGGRGDRLNAAFW